MKVIDTTLGIDLRDPRSIESYWNDDLIEALYFGPKKVSAGMRDAALYLAHEFTHYVRKDLLNKDIFESCVGERLVTEGIAESYSADVVGGQATATYCIVDEATVSWVEAHYAELEALVRTSLETTELMETLFYMFARIDFPVRTGYVFGYLAVRRYLQEQGLRTKDILGIDWRRVLRAQHEE